MTTGTLEAGAIPSRFAVARLAVGAAITIFVITRVYLLLLFVAHGTDLFIYFNYAVRGVDLGQRAYSEFAVEYPPLAYWLMTVPRYLAAEHLAAGDLSQPEVAGPAFGAFAFAFRTLMLLADALAFALICRVARLLNPRSVPWVAWGYLAITTTMAQFLYDRLDIGLLLLLLVWAYGRVASSGQAALTTGNILSYVALGLSVPYKLVGLFVLPLMLWGDWLAEGGDWRAARRVAWLGLAGAAAAAVPFFVQGLWSGADVFRFLAYHGQRGIEIESTYASLLFLGSVFGLPLSAEASHGSIDLVTPVSGLLATLSPIVLLLGLAALGGELWRRRPLDRLAVYRAGLLAVPLTLLCSKVLSAQYFLFGLPLLLLLAAEWDQRRMARMTALCFVLAALTASVFPYLWFPTFPGTGITNPFCLYPDLHPVPCLVLALRNGLLAIAWFVSWRATARVVVQTKPSRHQDEVAGKCPASTESAPAGSRRISACPERSRPSWGVTIALGFYLLLGILLKLTHGHFHDVGLVLLTLGFLAYVVLGGRTAAGGRGRSAWRVVTRRCGLVAVVFAGLQWLDPELIYATVPGFQRWLAPLGSGLLAIALILWLGTWKRVRLPGRMEHGLWLAAVGLAVALRVVAWHASPQPAIDVWVIGNLGCDQLLSGNNPYTAEYPNVYGDAYDHQPHFFYWPGYLLAAAPFRAMLGDVRAATVAADVLIVICLLAAGRSLHLPRKTVRLVCLLWLLHPVSLFVLEQAWIDPLLLGGVAVLVVCLLRGWWAAAGVALAMVVGMKQYGLLIAWLTMVFLWTHRAALPVAPNWRSILLAGGVTTAALFGPFLWLSTSAFYASTLEPYLAVELRSDALSIPALINNGWGVRVSDRILGALVLLAIGCVSLVLARGRCDLAHLLWASAVALGTFFLLGKLAFCNYYFLVSSLVLWHFLLLLAPPAASKLVEAQRRSVNQRTCSG